MRFLRGLVGLARIRPALTVVLIVATILTALPAIQAISITGDGWRGIPQSYGDEFIYYSHMREIATGNLFFGNPYYLEHRFDLPITLFGSSILAALPMFLGIPLLPTLAINFVLWGALFIVLFYALLRIFSVSRVFAAGVSLFAYLQSYDLIFRASVRQQVFPFLLLFYIGLAKIIERPEKKWPVVLTGIVSGSSFYIYGFLWQTIVVTLGLLSMYALARRAWTLLRSTLLASLLGGVIGAPALLYTVWITTLQYFWESVNHFGVVLTHLPVGELVYSGGWVVLALLWAGGLYLTSKVLREDSAFRFALVFIFISGLGHLVLQGSNVIAGKHFEIGEHVRRFIIPWLALALSLVCVSLWRHRKQFSARVRTLSFVGIAVLIAGNLAYAYDDMRRFVIAPDMQARWVREQTYAGTLSWLSKNVPQPAAIWGDPHTDAITIYIPALTRHYVLHEEFGQFNLLANGELHERYLVSQYFDGVTIDSLKEDMVTFAGRANTFHYPKTIERGVKFCRMFEKLGLTKECGEAPSASEFMGEKFFITLEEKFRTDIKPNIHDYLTKYHVSYILKDKVKNPEYRPEDLGATLVYEDEWFEIYAYPGVKP